ncbi:MAG: nitroreductase family protein [Pseudomonadota bacterium]
MEKGEQIIDLIKSRRSIREYTDKGVSDDAVQQIIEAGSWAPSGLNNQPWRFVVVRARDTKEKLAGLTHYGMIILNAPVVIPVFLSDAVSYDRTKDTLAVGACIQNMLLAIHGLGLGGVWLGEILKNKEEVRASLDLPEELELMAVVAIGHPRHTNQSSDRKPAEELIIKKI